MRRAGFFPSNHLPAHLDYPPVTGGVAAGRVGGMLCVLRLLPVAFCLLYCFRRESRAVGRSAVAVVVVVVASAVLVLLCCNTTTTTTTTTTTIISLGCDDDGGVATGGSSWPRSCSVAFGFGKKGKHHAACSDSTARQTNWYHTIRPRDGRC
jgi:hypothetical protein